MNLNLGLDKIITKIYDHSLYLILQKMFSNVDYPVKIMLCNPLYDQMSPDTFYAKRFLQHLANSSVTLKKCKEHA